MGGDLPEEYDAIDVFIAGELLYDPSKSRSAPVLVLETADEGKNGFLIPLVSGYSAFENEKRARKPYWATLEKMAGWTRYYLPGARLITAFERGTRRHLWDAYVPDASTALNVLREVNFNGRRTIDVVMTPSGADELDALDDEGQLGPDYARETATSMSVEYFSDIAGSATSDDGRVFVLKAHGPDGQSCNVAFPHSETSIIVEHIAMQSAHAKDDEGRQINSAFRTSAFALGTDPDGNAILGIQVGSTGTINFQLKGRMAEELMDLLAQFVTVASRGKSVN